MNIYRGSNKITNEISGIASDGGNVPCLQSSIFIIDNLEEWFE